MNAKLRSIFRLLSRRAHWESDLESELRYHLDRQVELNLAGGMTPAEAQRRARAALGGLESRKEECREARSGHALEALVQDLRIGARLLRRSPGFTLAAVLTLALGIGANTAVFSLVYGVLLRPLPYRDGSRLIVLHQTTNTARDPGVAFSPPEVADLSHRSGSVDGVVEHHAMSFLLLEAGGADRVDTGVVSANFFDVLGLQPLLGRTFKPGDDAPGAPAVLVLSYRYWVEHQGADPGIVGRVFQMNDRPHTIVGVLPPIPQYPVEEDVYMPTSACPFRARNSANRDWRALTLFARMKPGIAVAQARADLQAAEHGMIVDNPAAYPNRDGYALAADSLQDELTHRARTSFLVLLAAAGFVLLIACANVANLLLARLLQREREFQLRAALGAGRSRLVRQVLTESLLVSLTGGALAIVLAPPALTVLVRFAAHYTTRADEVRMDTPVLLFALALSLVMGAGFGLIPALRSGRDGSPAASSHGLVRAGSARLRQVLVVVQTAVTFVLLMGAGLMIRSFLRLQQVSPGFRPESVVSLRSSPGFSRYPDTASLSALGDRLLGRVRAVPGVTSAALAQGTPFTPGARPGAVGFEIENHAPGAGPAQPTVDVTVVGPAYFATVGQPMLQGREFNVRDNADAPGVAIINQTMARHRFPRQDPVGKRIRFTVPGVSTVEGGWLTIVGVAGDAREYGLDHPTLDEVYLAPDQSMFANVLVVRSSAPPATVVPALRAAVRAVDPLIAVDQVRTLEELERDSLATPRVLAVLLGIFAALALLISGGGIAAVMALSVRQRTRELGIRMALGGRRSAIVLLVLRQGMTLALIGAAAGLAGAVALTRFIAGLLYATSPADAATFACMALLFLAVAAAACFVPATQVTGIDPLAALRAE